MKKPTQIKYQKRIIENIGGKNVVAVQAPTPTHLVFKLLKIHKPMFRFNRFLPAFSYRPATEGRKAEGTSALNLAVSGRCLNHPTPRTFRTLSREIVVPRPRAHMTSDSTGPYRLRRSDCLTFPSCAGLENPFERKLKSNSIS